MKPLPPSPLSLPLQIKGREKKKGCCGCVCVGEVGGVGGVWRWRTERPPEFCIIGRVKEYLTYNAILSLFLKSFSCSSPLGVPGDRT